ncbi:MAG TPA: hypothetical protein PK156_45695 [Polyangium sp.]|nr:hypothetical protein [Polyangium sp.]
MFLIETASSPNVADVCVTSDRTLLYGVIEVPVKATFAPGTTARILAGAVGAAAGADAAQWPSAMADGVASALERYNSADYPIAVLGAFIAMSNWKIHICWAGTIRVHLVRHGATVRVTNDHNFIDDPVDGVTESLLSSGTDIAGCRFAASRAISARMSRPPASQIWEREPHDVLLVCSVYDHRNAPPAEYAKKLISDSNELLVRGDGHGFISVIRTVPRLPAE